LLKYKIVLKDIPSGRTRVEVEKLQQEEAILDFEIERLFCKQNYDRGFSRQNCSEATADLGV